MSWHHFFPDGKSEASASVYSLEDMITLGVENAAKAQLNILAWVLKFDPDQSRRHHQFSEPVYRVFDPKTVLSSSGAAISAIANIASIIHNAQQELNLPVASVRLLECQSPKRLLMYQASLATFSSLLSLTSSVIDKAEFRQRVQDAVKSCKSVLWFSGKETARISFQADLEVCRGGQGGHTSLRQGLLNLHDLQEQARAETGSAVFPPDVIETVEDLSGIFLYDYPPAGSYDGLLGKVIAR